MKVSEYAILNIVSIIIGNKGDSWYKKGSQLVAWFNKYGARDIYDKFGLPPNPDNKDQRMSRKQYAVLTLSKMNNSEQMRDILEEFINENICCVEEVQKIIAPEGYAIDKLDGKLHIIGGHHPVVAKGKTDAQFENLQNQVISHLQNAKLSICVAMAWFTNQKIADVLKEKAKDNVDIKLIIHKDHTNDVHGANLDGLCVKYMRAPNGGIMHDKFCVIDNRVVLTGSYNWSNKAETKNEENVLSDTHPDTVMKYSIKFKELFYS